MIEFLSKILGQNWRTTLAGIGVLAAVVFKCVTGGGQFFDCFQEGWSIAFTLGGVGLLVAKDGKSE